MKSIFFNRFVTAFLLIFLSGLSLGSEQLNNCKVNVDDTELMAALNDKYLEHSSLYTGGMHFKQLGSVEGSISIYLALTNQFDTLQKINNEKAIDSSSTANKIELYDTPAYLKRLTISGWAEEASYEIPPSEVLESALKVALEVQPAYKHIVALDLPYAFQYRQASFDLDIFTTLAEPVDWWLATEKPTEVSDLRIAVWDASKTNDFIDWLQFVASSSGLPHLQNWNFEDIPQRTEGYSSLKRHALKKWASTNSYAWLAALAETVSPSDSEAALVLDEFRKLSKKISSCNATRPEKYAYGMILLNAVRLGYKHRDDMQIWLASSKNDPYIKIRTEAEIRLNQYIFTSDSFNEYKDYWKTINSKISKSPTINALTAEKMGDFIIDKNFNKRDFDEVELRFISILPTPDLIKLIDQKNLANDSKRKLIRSAFLRSWVKSDIVDEKILKKLAEFEPSLEKPISEAITEKNKNIRKARLLKLVMENPAMTFLVGVHLYMVAELQPINEFVQYNSEDGSWWCETNSQKIVDKYADSTIKPFGFKGSNPETSGGSWGADFYNPGQKRAYLRGEKIVINNEMHQSALEKLKQNHALLAYAKSDDWQDFAKTPPAPAFFANKIYELEKTKSIKDEDMIELYKLLIRAAKKTCRNQNGTYETLKNARTKLQQNYGVTLN